MSRNEPSLSRKEIEAIEAFVLALSDMPPEGVLQIVWAKCREFDKRYQAFRYASAIEQVTRYGNEQPDARH